MVLLQITLLLLLHVGSDSWSATAFEAELETRRKSLYFSVLFFVLGRCKCSRASHSQYLQRPFGLPHFLAHFCHHGSTDVRWKILQGKNKKTFIPLSTLLSNKDFLYLNTFFCIKIHFPNWTCFWIWIHFSVFEYIFFTNKTNKLFNSAWIS